MDLKYNVVGWFEIPAIDMQRAVKFYEEVFGFKMDRQANMEDMGMEMTWFPNVGGMEEGQAYGSTGALVKHEMYKPSTEGTLVYFTAHSGDLANELGKVEGAGGRIIKEKMAIGEHGFIAVFMDSEGNAVAMHSMK